MVNDPPAGAAGHAPIADLMRAYLVADYRWQYAGDWHDLRIGLPAPALELLYPAHDTFGFLSAWNPFSVERDELANRNADHALHDALNASGLPFCAAFASAPNRSWREPSWAVMGMAEDAFNALTRRFGQLGTLWWTRGDTVRLRMDAARPGGIEGDEDVDWLRKA